MKLFLVMMILTGTLLLSGCEKPKKTTVAVTRSELPPPLTPAQLRLKELTSAVKPGMLEDEVVRVAGEPKTVRTTPGGKTPLVWQYDLGDGTRFDVRFDKNHHVAVAELESSSRAQ